MKPPELTATTSLPARRGDALLSTLWAGLVLAACETTYAAAERWSHPPEYLALSLALTLALALAVGAPAALVRAPVLPTLALWVGAAGGFTWGWPTGVAFGAAFLATALVPCARRASALVAGTTAALALACGFLKGPTIAEHLGHDDVLLYEAAGGTLLVAAVGALTPLALARVPARVGAWARVAALLVLGLGASLRPRLDAPDGQRRLPPPGYAGSAPRVADAGEREHVFLLVLDTVRADHLSLYGYGRPTTPELDRMVQRRPNAAVFTSCFANGTWTVPSHASLFTGRLPHEHGAHFALDGSVRYGFGLREQVPTLAESMKDSGYATLAGYANHWLRSVQGMGRGFDRYLRAMDRDALPFVGEALRERFVPGLCWGATKGGARADEVDATLLSLVEPWSQGPNPLFVFANYGDAHGPYAPPAPFRGRFAPSDLREPAEHLSLAQSPERREVLEARYDEEIAYLDSELGHLFRELERLQLLQHSWIFVTADHGEAFGEHGVLEHGTTVHNEVVHVPLIVFPPDGRRLAREDGPVSLVDVAATIAAIGGGSLGGPGRDLRQPSAGEASACIEFYGDPYKARTMGELARQPARSVVLGRFKLIARGEEYFLHDLERDAHEQVNLSTALPEVLEKLKALLPEFQPPTFSSDGMVPRPETLDSLRAMGYAGGEDGEISE